MSVLQCEACMMWVLAHGYGRGVVACGWAAHATGRSLAEHPKSRERWYSRQIAKQQQAECKATAGGTCRDTPRRDHMHRCHLRGHGPYAELAGLRSRVGLLCSVAAWQHPRPRQPSRHLHRSKPSKANGKSELSTPPKRGACQSQQWALPTAVALHCLNIGACRLSSIVWTEAAHDCSS
jgi:hypothetical protein